MTSPGLRALVPCLVLAAVLVSCRATKFYTQAMKGQWEVLSRARPIAKVSAAPGTSPELKRQLELVSELRAFAHDELKLPTHRQYRNYADLGRPFVVWNVVAAPEFSVEARSWAYPFVGRLKYRGFFSEKAAREEADDLKEEGLDVVVGGVRVYSTLGFFSDPVLNTFIKEDKADLAETLFHELTHARFFVAGDTDFNEAYATAAGQLGVRAWLRSKGDANSLRRYEQALARNGRVLELLKGTRAELAALYDQDDDMEKEDMRREKARILGNARARYEAMRRAASPSSTQSSKMSGTLNNARLAALATYHDLVPAFVRLFNEQGGDWEKFHRAVAAMKSLSKEERRVRLGESHHVTPPSGLIHLDARR